ncbi:hypothetical protein [Amycolatopsis panacis]|uniref:NB-ARC domain-containing protein n=1 Tax=Amycolatopsis panacis TaxID=2340917 RepID=A0A419IAJ5_9PSEU|nr:hypothetical protein [Amycolatopsis panacis]RJQ90687.1 hypothetical protein D5S19_02935 [Amycolatopsis panacis]
MSDGNFFDGTAHTVFQGRDVYGGVHFHPPAGPVVAPARVLEPPRHYRNNEVQLGELGRIHDEFADGVAVAIVLGAPGSGRSTLGQCWAYRNRERFPDGCFSVRMGRRAVTDVLAELLELSGHKAEQLPASLEARSAMWQRWSGDKKIALLLDDATSAAQVRAVMPTGAGSMVLVVEAGGLAELRRRHSARDVRLDPLTDEAALGVLTELAGAERLTEEPGRLAALLEICGGSAAELTVAGAMLAEATEWSIEYLIGRIKRKGGLASAVFDVAYDRLVEGSQACYRAFGAHPGDGDLAPETLMAVLSLDLDDVQDALRQLRRANLIEPTGGGRYRMTGLTRLHAAKKAGGLRETLVAYYAATGLAVAERVGARGWNKALWPGFPVDGRSAEAARGWLRVERGNLVAAMENAEPEDVCRLALALWPVHQAGGRTSEMIAVNELGIRAAQVWGSKVAESVLRTQRGFAARQARDWDTAYTEFGRAAELAREAGSVTAEASAVEGLGLAYVDVGAPEAEETLRHNLKVAERLGIERRIAVAEMHLAKVVAPAEAVGLLDSAERVLGSEPSNRVKILLWRGRTAMAAGDLDVAVELFARVAEEKQAYLERISAHRGLAEIARTRADVEQARAYAEDGLNIAQLRGYTAEAAEFMEWLARLDDHR